MNGDGFSDVIVGAWFYDNGETDEGRAFVYFGSASGLASSPAWTAESNQANADFSTSVATAGDVNGDGYSDVIIGAPYFDDGQADEGAAFVYLGSSSGLATAAAWTAESDQASAAFGAFVGTAGDVNGDGYSEVIAGAYLYDNGQTDEGAAFVYLGSSSGLATAAAWTVESDQASAQLGACVGTAGDVNGDGYSDVVVGVWLFDNGQTDEGEALLYLGSPSGLATVASVDRRERPGQCDVRCAVGTAGDVNGDGYSDVIVSAYHYDNGEIDEGRAFVYLGAPSGPAVSVAWTAESNQDSTNFGASVAPAGDVNGDGYSDVIVGAGGYDNGQVNEGRAFVYLGSASGLASSPAWTAESDQAGARFGRAATAGDVNGDGYSDVIVGAMFYHNGETDEGRAFVYLGSSSGLASSPAWTAESDQSFAHFGVSVSTAGDVNGDGYSDVIVGADQYANGQGGEGAAFVYLGSSSGLASSPAWTAESDQGGAKLSAVATAGDVNGDGYSDVIVGAQYYDNTQTDQGRAFVYLGSSSGLALSPAWTADGNQADTWFGYSVSTAGDVNGDGYGDVIVGAFLYANGQSGEGGAFVYLGSATGLATSPAWTGEGNQGDVAFGVSVSTAGDVNGDGYSDVIVGAHRYDHGQADEGRAFVYMGSASGLATTAAWTAESDQDIAFFGGSVATAEDVNGDGYGDVIVGAYRYDNGETDEGRAFVYYGNGGDGLDRVPQQRRADNLTPIGSLGKSDSKTSFRLKALGRTPAGRGKVRLVSEVKPFGTAFNGAGTVAGPWTNTGVPAMGVGSGVVLNELQTGLSTESVYHWRVRLETDSPFFPRSPWFTPSANGPQEADFRAPGFTVQPLFGPWTDFASAPRPRSVAIGDFNGDGRPDLAVADSADNRVSVLLGNGNGTFGVKTDYNTGSHPASVTVGDFNDDGHRDLAVANLGSNKVSVLLGNGNGTFGSKTDFGTGTQPISVATGDFNTDGVLDLAVANQGATTVSVLLGTGNGTFGTKSDFTTGSGPVSVAIGDLNGDLKLDLAVASQSSNTVSVLLGDGLGSFTLASSPVTGSTPSCVAIRDLNGNSVPDLVATNYGSNTASVLLGNGDGTFGAKSDFGTGSSPFSVAIADFDGDGKSDLSVANAGSNTVSILIGNGAGSFGTKTDFATGTTPEFVAAGDLNGDRRRDLAVACAGSNRVSILLNQGGAAVADLAPIVAAPFSVNAEEGGVATVLVTASDLDGEGINSLVANLSALPAGNDAVFTSNPSRTFGTLTWHPALARAGSYNAIFTASNALSGSDTTRIDVAPTGTSIVGTLLWTPTSADVGAYDVNFKALDQFGDTLSATTHVTVIAGSGAPAPTPAPGRPNLTASTTTKGPVIRAAPSQEVTVGNTLVLEASASFATTLTANTSALPADNTATFATDREAVVTAPSTVVANPGNVISIVVSAADPDGDAIATLSADAALPPGNNAVFTPNGTNTGGTFTWTPTLSDVGTYGVTFRAANALVGAAPTVITVGDKLAGNWKLNGNGANGVTGDSLTNYGGVIYVPGKLGLAAKVDGTTNARLEGAATHSYDLLPSGFTAECWVKPRSLLSAPDPTIVRADSAGNSEAWEIFLCRSGCPQGSVGVRVRHLGAPTELVSSGGVPDTLFHHIAMTYDGSALKLYVDGALDTSLAVSGLRADVGGGKIALGNAPLGGSPLDGLIDNVRIWKAARTASEISTTMNAEIGLPTAVGGSEAPRHSFALFQNRPNPFNPHTLIQFGLATACRVRLYVYDVRGRLVARLVDRQLPAGPQSVLWRGQNDAGHPVASGVYFYRLETPHFTSTRQMVLLR